MLARGSLLQTRLQLNQTLSNRPPSQKADPTATRSQASTGFDKCPFSDDDFFLFSAKYGHGTTESVDDPVFLYSHCGVLLTLFDVVAVTFAT
jgi:hypothetical protein